MNKEVTKDYFNTPFWQDRFHWCAFVAYLTAQAEGRHEDVEYVRKLAYANYENKDITV
jgi:hypothetical protein